VRESRVSKLVASGRSQDRRASYIAAVGLCSPSPDDRRVLDLRALDPAARGPLVRGCSSLGCLYSLGHGGQRRAQTIGIIWMLLIDPAFSANEPLPFWVGSPVSRMGLGRSSRLAHRQDMGMRITNSSRRRFWRLGERCDDAVSRHQPRHFRVHDHTITGSIIGGLDAEALPVRWGWPATSSGRDLHHPGSAFIAGGWLLGTEYFKRQCDCRHRADITRLAVDAIVNRQTPPCSARRGRRRNPPRRGPELLRECRTLGGCATGDAKITTLSAGGEARDPHVGPVWNGGADGEPELLASCYRRSSSSLSRTGSAPSLFPPSVAAFTGIPWNAPPGSQCASAAGLLGSATRSSE